MTRVTNHSDCHINSSALTHGTQAGIHADNATLNMAVNSGQFLEGNTIIVAGGGIASSCIIAAFYKRWDQALKPPTIKVFDRDAEDVAK